MTPAARVAAAIDILDAIKAGTPAERALTGWARQSRFAGAKDRLAVRDHVFDALRRRRSWAALGGAETGRGLMLGALREGGRDPAGVFTGEGHAPAPLSAEESATPSAAMTEAERLDIPDWLLPRLRAGLGADTEPALLALRDRAAVHLRVNLARGDRQAAIASLAEDGVLACAHPDVRTALDVYENERKVRVSGAYSDGRVELQDAASQAAVLRLPLAEGQRVLDYCAGGGGKSLAILGLGLPGVAVTAHDADPGRMADLPARAARAGVRIETAKTPEVAGMRPFDLVLCDAPCSGSGTWRRAPDAKWRLTPDALDRLLLTQDAVLDAAAPLVRPGGALAYATCSILQDENRARVDAFMARAGDAAWVLADEMRLLPAPLWDGFYLACLTRTA